MISSYLMMRYINSNRYPNDSLGVSTARFIGHKYKGLFPILLPSAILGYVIRSIMVNRTTSNFFLKAPLLLFEIFPTSVAGFSGYYVVGISWYLSAMFIALAILYPLCKKYGSNFILTVCPLLSILIYGFLSHTFGHLAVGNTYADEIIVNAGILRGIAASSLGCILYEICAKLSKKQVSLQGRIVFTLLEIVGYFALFGMIHYQPKSAYDYICVLLIFILLLIGISGLSATSILLKGKWTKHFGSWSTLIVLNHFYWKSFLLQRLGEQYINTNKVYLYYLAVACTCILVHFLSRLIINLMNKNLTSKLWIEE